ncbi:hypothetical protein [Nocardia huaxiensis]|uniref:Uncharacterized protein n=1 Tax=Nocardia huaxiensis TaxID=2755382 RepID=A0A7D6ZNE6_9NOCA|nr:hypothetical protein [Nocardia huaxiensis]QLY29705.1 hypothetical protein H0264_31445 [Nocardia huaxiensis]UFS96719.1 hypothetical protein LPY97_01935 [Nocardia huaxiensis]
MTNPPRHAVTALLSGSAAGPVAQTVFATTDEHPPRAVLFGARVVVAAADRYRVAGLPMLGRRS